MLHIKKDDQNMSLAKRMMIYTQAFISARKNGTYRRQKADIRQKLLNEAVSVDGKFAVFGTSVNINNNGLCPSPIL